MLDDWTAQVCRVLDLHPDIIDATAILDLARDAAHSVARPAAPLTTYLLGIAVGRGQPPAEAAAAIRLLLSEWPAPTG